MSDEIKEPANDNKEKLKFDAANIMALNLLSGDMIVGLYRSDLSKNTNGLFTVLEKPLKVLTSFTQLPNNEIGTQIAAVPYALCGNNDIVSIASGSIISFSKANEDAIKMFIRTNVVVDQDKKQKEFKKPELVWENPDSPLKSDKKVFLNVVEVDEDNPIIN